MDVHKYLIIACVLALTPSFVYAAGTVRINEIAWMGTKKSADAEWIELFNIDTAKVSLNGWTLKTKDGSPDIHFSSKDTISPQGYFLLERTSDKTVPDIKADKIYTGSLKNAGETLILTNSASTTVDTVVGGKNWCIVGGNNTTKQTAQRTATGWITATGTPRKANATVGTVPSCATIQGSSGAGGAGATAATATTTTDAPPSAEGGASNTATTTTPVTTTSYSGHYGPPEFEPVPPVFISIGNNIDTVAGADVRFGAVVTDKVGKQYTSAIVYWAFGDGSKATGTSVFKNYRAPGTYAVVANAVQGLGSGEDDMIVTVRNAHVSMPSISAHGITLRNDTPYRLDMSLWKLRAGTTTFAFPRHTVILPNTSVLFPRDITKLPVTNDTELLYPNGKEVARHAPSNARVKRIMSDTRKLSLVHVRYSTVQGGEKGNSGTVRQKIIRSHNATSAYDTKASIAPTPATQIAGVGALVARASESRRAAHPARLPATSTSSIILNRTSTSATTSPQTSFTHRFLSSAWTLPLLLVLILSAGFLMFL